ncbi:hypothetical protein BGZ81_010847 [Podila clonocystis]|nr:hypothetical protein BGZ81_010847 [Podila clonocystis]
MKTSSIILATLALVASVSAQAADTPANRWCKAFGASCQTAANTVCGMNRQSEWNCKANFNANDCQSYEIKCNCIPAGGAITAASQVALINTFQATNGACQNVPMRPVTSAPVTTAPPPNAIGGSLPTTTTTPTPTPTHSNSAGIIKSNSALAAAVAMGAVALAI